MHNRVKTSNSPNWKAPPKVPPLYLGSHSACAMFGDGRMLKIGRWDELGMSCWNFYRTLVEILLAVLRSTSKLVGVQITTSWPVFVKLLMNDNFDGSTFDTMTLQDTKPLTLPQCSLEPHVRPIFRDGTFSASMLVWIWCFCWVWVGP